MRIKKGFILRTVCGEHVIVGEGLDPINFGRMLCLNETATFIWKKAQEYGEFTAEKLAVAVCHEYDVDLLQARTDVKETLDNWTKLGVIE